MATGHDVDTMEYMRALPDEDWVQVFFEVPFVYPPAAHFHCDSGASYLLAAALTGPPLPASSAIQMV